MLKERLKGAVIGIVATAILMTSIPAFAKVATEAVTISYNNIKIVLNGRILSTENEPFVLNGRTYLPVRDIADALGLAVEWDRNTQTVYLSNSANAGQNQTQGSQPQTNAGQNQENQPQTNTAQNSTNAPPHKSFSATYEDYRKAIAASKDESFKKRAREGGESSAYQETIGVLWNYTWNTGTITDIVSPSSFHGMSPSHYPISYTDTEPAAYQYDFYDKRIVTIDELENVKIKYAEDYIKIQVDTYNGIQADGAAYEKARDKIEYHYNGKVYKSLYGWINEKGYKMGGGGGDKTKDGITYMYVGVYGLPAARIEVPVKDMLFEAYVYGNIGWLIDKDTFEKALARAMAGEYLE